MTRIVTLILLGLLSCGSTAEGCCFFPFAPMWGCGYTPTYNWGAGYGGYCSPWSGYASAGYAPVSYGYASYGGWDSCGCGVSCCPTGCGTCSGGCAASDCVAAPVSDSQRPTSDPISTPDRRRELPDYRSPAERSRDYDNRGRIDRSDDDFSGSDGTERNRSDSLPPVRDSLPGSGAPADSNRPGSGDFFDDFNSGADDTSGGFGSGGAGDGMFPDLDSSPRGTRKPPMAEPSSAAEDTAPAAADDAGEDASGASPATESDPETSDSDFLPPRERSSAIVPSRFANAFNGPTRAMEVRGFTRLSGRTVTPTRTASGTRGFAAEKSSESRRNDTIRWISLPLPGRSRS